MTVWTERNIYFLFRAYIIQIKKKQLEEMMDNIYSTHNNTLSSDYSLTIQEPPGGGGLMH